MSEKLYHDPLTGRMTTVQRQPLLQHIYEQQSNATVTLEMLQRLAELERRGA